MLFWGGRGPFESADEACARRLWKMEVQGASYHHHRDHFPFELFAPHTAKVCRARVRAGCCCGGDRHTAR